METENLESPDLLELCNYFWDEYKYRHDLIWQRIFRFTAAVVVLSIIPYVQENVACLLGPWIIMAPSLAVLLAAFVLSVMRNETVQRLISHRTIRAAAHRHDPHKVRTNQNGVFTGEEKRVSLFTTFRK